MKTMMELLIRLQELRSCCERAARNPQLTRNEKATPCSFKSLVRDCLPADVLDHYDQLKETDRDLLESPEVFAMAVIVSTYRSLSPRKRQQLVNHFATPPAVACRCNGHTTNRLPRVKPRGRRTTRRQLVVRD